MTASTHEAHFPTITCEGVVPWGIDHVSAEGWSASWVNERGESQKPFDVLLQRRVGSEVIRSVLIEVKSTQLDDKRVFPISLSGESKGVASLSLNQPALYSGCDYCYPTQ